MLAKEFLTNALDTGVQVESHSRALARAEQLFGNDTRARTSVVHLFVGNVVDAAIATSGAVHSGPGGAAGEIAHLRLAGDDAPCPCGRRGCLQAAASNRTLGERAAELGIVAEPVLDLVIEAGAMLIPGCWEELTSEIGDRAHDAIPSSFGRDVLSVAAGAVVLGELYA